MPPVRFGASVPGSRCDDGVGIGRAGLLYSLDPHVEADDVSFPIGSLVTPLRVLGEGLQSLMKVLFTGVSTDAE